MNLRALILLGYFLCAAAAGWSQSLPILDSFENYQAGGHLCSQSPSYWTTWNNGPGTAEDPLVTDSLAHQGSKSLSVRGTNDALLLLGNRTGGRYRISFFLFIPSERSGYYGLLRHFDGPSSDWGLNCYFASKGEGTAQTGNPAVARSFTYPYNRWFNVTNIIDLDNDHAEIYIDSVLVAEFTWSASGPGKQGYKALDAADLFAWTGDTYSPGAFFDDVHAEELPPLPPPRYFHATVTGDTVVLQWQQPDTTGQLGYKIYRDSAIISDLVTGLNYSDQPVYPGIHDYLVKAVYPSGMSPAAGPAEATVQGGTERQDVLLEIATGTWCTYCPGAAMGADDLVTGGKQVAVIEYHAQDAYENTASKQRNSFYKVPGYPTAQFDGGLTVAGGDALHSMYPVYLPLYEQRIVKKALFSLDIQVSRPSDRDLEISITSSKIYSYGQNQLRLRLALTESHIPQHWEGFMEEVNFVCRNMYPDATGTLLDFSTAQSFTNHFSVMIDSAWKVSNCELVAFLQDDLSREVLQCSLLRIYPLGNQDVPHLSVITFPNPVATTLEVRAGSIIRDFILYDLLGTEKLSMKPGTEEMTTDLSGLAPGVYLARIHAGDEWLSRKIILSR